MSRRVVGLIIAAVGAVLLFLSAAADLVGIGSADYFGNQQIIGTVVGAVAVVAGLLVAFLPARLMAGATRDASRPARLVKRRRQR